MKKPDETLLPGVTLRLFEDGDTAAEALAREVAGRLRQAVEARDRAMLVVSGGRTPVAFLEALSGYDLDWSRVLVLPSDERWVAPDSDQSNSRLIRQHLLRGPATAARLAELVENVSTSPEYAAEWASDRLCLLDWPADVVVLGMGEDGHTASLFPDAPELAEALSDTATPVVMTTPASQPVARLSLSARVLSGAPMTALLLQGEGKMNALREAASSPLAIGPMPVRYFFQQRLEVFWSP